MIKPVVYIQSVQELDELYHLGGRNFIIASRDLSRFGEIERDDFFDLIDKAKSLNIKPLIEWDLLMTEKTIRRSIDVLNKISFDSIQAIRIQDCGGMQYILEAIPEVPIQLILENGNNNLRAIRSWNELIGKRLNRIILPREMTSVQITEVLQNITVESELCGYGKVPISYTPRHLLSGIGISQTPNLQHAWVTSSEMPNARYWVLENSHGTFMFLNKDLCLLPFYDLLANAGLTHFRFDNRFTDFSKDDFKEIFETGTLSLSGDFLTNMKRSFTHGFFLENTTDSKFSFLKNQYVDHGSDDYIGYVIEVLKNAYIAVKIENVPSGLEIGRKVNLVTPEGKRINVTIAFIKDTSMQDKLTVLPEEIILINYVKGISNKTLLLRS